MKPFFSGLLLILGLCGFTATCPAEPAEDLEAWWVDPLRQLLIGDTSAETRGSGSLHAARGEVEAVQLAVRCNTACSVSVKAPPFAEDLPIRIRTVGRVPITRGTHYTPVEERVAPPPVDLPDPLYSKREMDLAAGETQSFWLDVTVPEGAAPGSYRTTVTVTAVSATAGDQTLELPLSLKVYPVTIPFEGALMLTNWFSVRPKYLGFEDAPVGSEGWWQCADLLFDSMWAHRQNFFWTPLGAPWVQPVVRDDGNLDFDFAFFDRWVEAFSRPRGGDRLTFIEGQPIAARSGGYSGQVKARVWQVKEGKPVSELLEPDDPAAREGYRIFLEALKKHLVSKGWLDRFRIHLCDEPHGGQLASYAVIAGYVREFAPEFKIMEALDVKDDFAFFEKHCDVWVPQVGRFEASLPGMMRRLARGEEVWIYTCLWPNGKYPNRFVDYPLIKTRVLQWINFRWGFTGYLHWGFNHWRGDPFKELEPHHAGSTHLPAGDAWIVYPGAGRILDSVRHEAMRDGVEDFELLTLLAAKNPARAQAMASAVVRTFTDYERDEAAFRAVRILLLEAFE